MYASSNGKRSENNADFAGRHTALTWIADDQTRRRVGGQVPIELPPFDPPGPGLPPQGPPRFDLDDPFQGLTKSLEGLKNLLDNMKLGDTNDAIPQGRRRP